MSESKQKVYVGRLEQTVNKFGEAEIKIAFGPDDMKKLQENLNEKGWVNMSQRTSKDGKPYIEIWSK